jgi:hypothetical protein
MQEPDLVPFTKVLMVGKHPIDGWLRIPNFLPPRSYIPWLRNLEDVWISLIK